MGRLFVIIGGFFVLALTAALIVPPFIDWSNYRTAFEREASRILGHPVFVEGEAKARLLPFPSVSFTNVRVGEDRAHPLMQVAKFSMDAELMPFLRGEILIFDMLVDAPQVHMQLDREGRLDWASRSQSNFDPRQVKLEKLTIKNGEVLINDEATGRNHRVQAVNAELVAESLAGPWQVKGSLDFDGEKISVDAGTGVARSGEGLRTRIRLLPDTIPALFETDGDFSVDDGKLHYNGRFDVRSADMASGEPNRTVSASSASLSSRPLLSQLRITGNFQADSQHFSVDEFRMEQGEKDNPYIVNGTALFDYGDNAHFAIRADGQQILFGSASSASEQDKGEQTISLSNRLPELRRMLEQLPIPTIPGSVNLHLPAIIAGDTTIRSIVIQAEPDLDGWNISQLEADFPGRTRIEAKGKLSIGERFGFNGDVLLASRQPSAFAGWLGFEVDDALRRLPSAGFSGRLVATPHMLRIDALELGLGGATFKGDFERQTAEGNLESMRLSLDGGAVDADTLAALSSLLRKSERLSDVEYGALDASIKAGPLDFADFSIGKIDAGLRLRDGRLDIDRMIVTDLAGARIVATGMVTPFALRPSGRIDVTVLAENLSDLVKLLEREFPDIPAWKYLAGRADIYPALFENSSLNIVASALGAGNAPSESIKAADDKGKGARHAPLDQKDQTAGSSSEISFSLAGEIGSIKLDMSGSARNLSEDAKQLEMQGAGTALSRNGEDLLALLGMPSMPLGLIGPINADFSMQGAPNAGMRTQLRLTADDAALQADGLLSVHDDEWTASGKASMQAEDIEPYAASLGYALPSYGGGTAMRLGGDFQYAKGIIRLPNLDGDVSGDAFSAKIEASLADSGLPNLRGEVKLASLDLGGLASLLVGNGFGLAFDGVDNFWPKEKFARQTALPLLGDVVVSAATALPGTQNPISGFSARIIKTAHELTLENIAGQWAGGQVSGKVELRNDHGNAVLFTDIGLSGLNLADFHVPGDLQQTVKGSVFSGTGKAAITLSGNGETMDALVHSLNGTVHLGIDQFSLNLFDPLVLNAMLKQLDEQEKDSEVLAGGEKTREKLSHIAAMIFNQPQEVMNDRGFSVDQAEFALSVAGGTMRMPMMRLEDTNALLESDFTFDLAAMKLATSGRFALKTAQQAESANEPEVTFSVNGPYQHLKVDVDDAPLIQFLTRHVLEREQQRVEAMQAALREKLALRRQVETYKHRAEERERVKREEEALRLEREQRAADEALRNERRVIDDMFKNPAEEFVQ